jgi:molecular chaperone IbpA
VLSVSGKKQDDAQHQYTHHGIAHRTFERKFNLADYVEVTGATLENGLLSISLVKEVPEAMKPKTIAINASFDAGQSVLEHAQTAQPDAKSARAQKDA